MEMGSSLVAEIVHDPDRGSVRAYQAAAVAREFGVSPKTVRNWTDPGEGDRPKLRGWSPKSVVNPTRGWLVDADDVDAQLRVARGEALLPADERVAAERKQLDAERQTFELERSLWRQDRLTVLEDENVRLRDEVARLRAQVSALGAVVHDLTREAV